MADYNGEKISFLVLNTERRYLPPRANEANQQNRKKAEGRKNHNNDKAVFFELEHPTTTTTTVTSMYTIHTQCQRNLLRCHQPGDSDTEVLNSK